MFCSYTKINTKCYKEHQKSCPHRIRTCKPVWVSPSKGDAIAVLPEDNMLSRRDSNPYYAPSEGVVLPLHHETISRNKMINQDITFFGVKAGFEPCSLDSQSSTLPNKLQSPFSRIGRTRTCGLCIPNAARYQLRYYS